MATLVPPAIVSEKSERIVSVGRDGYAKVTPRNSMTPRSDAGSGRAPAGDSMSIAGTRSMTP